MTRRTSRTLMLVMVTLALLATVSATVAQEQGQQGRQGQRAGMGDATYLERSWTAVCFQLECTQEQILALMPIYAEQLQIRTEAIAAAREAEDFEAIGKAYTDCKANLEAELGNVLSDEQWTAFQALAETWNRGRGGRGGGGGGGGGGGQ